MPALLVFFPALLLAALVAAGGTQPLPTEPFAAHLKSLGKRTCERRLSECKQLKQLVDRVSKRPHLYQAYPAFHPLDNVDCRDYRHYKTEADGVYMMFAVYANAAAILKAVKKCIMRRAGEASPYEIYTNQYISLVLPGIVLETPNLPLFENATVKLIRQPEFALVRRKDTVMELVPVHNPSAIFPLANSTNDVLIIGYHVAPKQLVPPDTRLATWMVLPQKCSCGQFKHSVFDREPFDYSLHDLQRIRRLNGGDMSNFCKSSNAHFAEVVAEINRIAGSNPIRQKRIFDDFFPDSYATKIFLPTNSTILQWNLGFGRIYEANHVVCNVSTKFTKRESLEGVKVIDSPAILLDSIAKVGVAYSEHQPVCTLLMLGSGCLPTTAFDHYRDALRFMGSPMVFHWLAILLGAKLSAIEALKVLAKHTNAKCQRLALSRFDVVLVVNSQLVKRGHILVLGDYGLPINAEHDGLVVLEGADVYLFHF